MVYACVGKIRTVKKERETITNQSIKSCELTGNEIHRVYVIHEANVIHVANDYIKLM